MAMLTMILMPIFVDLDDVLIEVFEMSVARTMEGRAKKSSQASRLSNLLGSLLDTSIALE